ncbi:LysR family transcriptional regulator [Microbacteriaceae bacterium 4G12]
MNIEQLKLIVTLAEEKQFSRVATKLNLTPSAVSQSISNLEKELDMKLFNRSKSGTFLTTEGLHIIKTAYEILGKVDEIFDHAKGKQNRPKIKIRFAVIPGIITSLIKSMKQFKSEFPFVEMEILEGTTQQILTYLKSEQVDFALITYSDAIQNQNIPYNVKKITNSDLYVTVSKHSKLAVYDQINYKTIMKHSLALYQDDYILNYVHNMKMKTGDQPKTLFLTNNLHAIIYAVRNNLAITIAPQFSILNDFTDFLDDLKILPIKDDNWAWAPFSLWLVQPKDNSLTEIADTLLYLIQQHIRRL